jgi:hypothetical protein
MASSSERKLEQADYYLITAVLNDLVAKLRRVGTKAIFKHLNVQRAVRHIYQFDNAYIVDNAYLVIYDIDTPWYTDEDCLVLSELLVLRLAVSGDFSVVPAFLERKGREAGCQLVVAGTALAKTDKVLASLYHNHGWSTETHTITKEP